VKQCIFGGSFDPPHEGHLRLARTACASLGLDRLFWVPSQDPPHKASPATPFAHRLEMVRLAIAGLPGQEASGIEAGLPSPSYSLYTIRALKAERGRPGDAWYFLIGADNWAIFPQWHRPDEVLKEAVLAVYPREGFSPGPLPPGVLALDMELVPGRSSDIRAALERGASPEAAGVLPALRGYIAAHGLYASKGAPKEGR
jgi:nicotinate-nucleotide adenylyltransferase